MPEDSLKNLRSLLDKKPDESSVRYELAETLLKYGLFAEAEEHFRILLRKEPGRGIYLFGLAESFVRQGRAREAVVALETELEPSERSWDGWRVYVEALASCGDQAMARAAYGEGVALDPTMRNAGLEKLLGLADGLHVEPLKEAAPMEFPPPSAWLERPLVRFKDVGGMDEAKEQLNRKLVYPLKHDDMASQFGMQVGGGLLLYGPPGCGKTYLARAVAGEVNATFLSVGLHDVMDLYSGQSERNLHQLFEQARVHRPCVLFFDEVDALGANRASLKNSSSRNLVNQFLSELDSAVSSNEEILVLAATNAPWHLDPAFRRPGRFDKVLFIPPPDEAARLHILEVNLEGKPCEDLDLATIAKLTEGLSGADISGVVSDALENALSESIKTGRLVLAGMKHLEAAVRQARPGMKDWFAAARNHVLFSNEGGFYDGLKEYMGLP